MPYPPPNPRKARLASSQRATVRGIPPQLDSLKGKTEPSPQYQNPKKPKPEDIGSHERESEFVDCFSVGVAEEICVDTEQDVGTLSQVGPHEPADGEWRGFCVGLGKVGFRHSVTIRFFAEMHKIS